MFISWVFASTSLWEIRLTDILPSILKCYTSYPKWYVGAVHIVKGETLLADDWVSGVFDAKEFVLSIIFLSKSDSDCFVYPHCILAKGAGRVICWPWEEQVHCFCYISCNMLDGSFSICCYNCEKMKNSVLARSPNVTSFCHFLNPAPAKILKLTTHRSHFIRGFNLKPAVI